MDLNVEGGKERQTFSVTLVFEVKILLDWAGEHFSTQSTESAHSALFQKIII